jgi:hypothetical protein
MVDFITHFSGLGFKRCKRSRHGSHSKRRGERKWWEGRERETGGKGGRKGREKFAAT